MINNRHCKRRSEVLYTFAPLRLHGYILCLFILCFNLPADAAENQDFTATYGLYTAGVRMIEIESNFKETSKKYDVRTSAKTIGVFEKILPWSGLFETNGEAGYKPVRHDYSVSWRGDSETSTFRYKPAGVFKSMTLTSEGITKDNPVDTDITKNTRDVLSAMMVMFDGYRKDGTCAGDVMAFDNARSFIIRFKDAGNGLLENPRLSSYTGPAHACTVEIIPQKGNWPKKPRGWLKIQEQAKAGGKLPTLWLAKPTPDLPAIPVRIDIHTKYGDVIAHLRGIK